MQLKLAEEKNLSLMLNKEQAIFVLKPDADDREVYGYDLADVIDGLLMSSGLNIVCESDRRLGSQEIRDLYPILNKPDPIFGEEWKQTLIDHVSSGNVHSLLVEGKDANKKAKIIKNHLRKSLCDQTTEVGKVIKNIAHVPDEEDFSISKKILFNK